MGDSSSAELTIINYHYVRNLKDSSYPEIKGRTLDEFKYQLDYLQKNYVICSSHEVTEALNNGGHLPNQACWLTFDDGIIDHYLNVFPLLLDRGLKASFYVSAAPITGKSVLDVHKIHFLLAAVSDHHELVKEILFLLRPYRSNYDIAGDDILYETYAQKPHRFDKPNTIFIKRLLQDGLMEPVRSGITKELFKKYVTADEHNFAAELYMSMGNLQEMVDNGMEVGGHGNKHVRLALLSDADQEREVCDTWDFLSAVYRFTPQKWTMAYPYGSYNLNTISLLRERGCSAALTTEPAVVQNLQKPWELYRLDTNDIPIK